MGMRDSPKESVRRRGVIICNDLRGADGAWRRRGPRLCLAGLQLIGLTLIQKVGGSGECVKVNSFAAGIILEVLNELGYSIGPRV